MPPGETTYLLSPPTLTVSVMWLAEGVVCATSFAQRGAHRHITTITRKSAPNASAVLLRLRRRSASLYGPTPPSPWVALVPRGTSGSNAVGTPGAGAVGSAAISSWGALARPSSLSGCRSYFSCQVLQSFRNVGCMTADAKSMRLLMNFGTCSDPYTVTYAFFAVYSSSACHWLATELRFCVGVRSSFFT